MPERVVRYQDIADTFVVRTSLTVQARECPGRSSER
jgi:hypothetical protein